MNTPRASRQDVLDAIPYAYEPDEVIVVGVRGYYRDSMGAPGVNDFGIYDDAIFVLSPDTFVSFNANTDPSVKKRDVAILLPGIYPYKPGLHGLSRPNPYPAFRPATPNEELPVMRYGEATIPSKRPGVAINIHRGGNNTTSSLGCQTIHPSQWNAFHALLSLELKKWKQKVFNYILIEGPLR